MALKSSLQDQLFSHGSDGDRFDELYEGVRVDERKRVRKRLHSTGKWNNSFQEVQETDGACVSSSLSPGRRTGFVGLCADFNCRFYFVWAEKLGPRVGAAAPPTSSATTTAVNSGTVT